VSDVRQLERTSLRQPVTYPEGGTWYEFVSVLAAHDPIARLCVSHVESGRLSREQGLVLCAFAMYDTIRLLSDAGPASTGA